MPVEEVYRLYGLTKEEYEGIVKRLGREPNHVELGILGALWSEHCSYKSSKRLLKLFPARGRMSFRDQGRTRAL